MRSHAARFARTGDLELKRRRVGRASADTSPAPAAASVAPAAPGAAPAAKVAPAAPAAAPAAEVAVVASAAASSMARGASSDSVDKLESHADARLPGQSVLEMWAAHPNYELGMRHAELALFWITNGIPEYLFPRFIAWARPHLLERTAWWLMVSGHVGPGGGDMSGRRWMDGGRWWSWWQSWVVMRRRVVVVVVVCGSGDRGVAVMLSAVLRGIVRVFRGLVPSWALWGIATR